MSVLPCTSHVSATARIDTAGNCVTRSVTLYSETAVHTGSSNESIPEDTSVSTNLVTDSQTYVSTLPLLSRLGGDAAM